MDHVFTLDGEDQRLWLVRRRGSWWLSHDGVEGSVALECAGGQDFRLRVGDGSYPLVLAARDDVFYVHIGGEAHEVAYRNPLSRLAATPAAVAGRLVCAPMPGTVVQVRVRPGDAVSSGETLMVIESMKLEMELRAPRAGVIENVAVVAGATFERDAVLATLVPLTEP